VKVLVIGSGAREHALVRGLSADPDVSAVVAAPGNPGIDLIAQCEPLADVCDAAAVLAVAARHTVDLVVVGPEAPLVAGVTDALVAEGIACFGPTAEAARLEGSKSFAKDVMSAAEVPTGLAHVCSTLAEVEDALDAFGPRTSSRRTAWPPARASSSPERQVALDHAAACLAKPDGRVVIEEFLDGPEVSLFCLCDGTTAVPLVPAQDFKRVGDDDAGPNTGGMGAYSPLPWAPHERLDGPRPAGL
jgi:phosphoribosylamine--glycine ligase